MSETMHQFFARTYGTAAAPASQEQLQKTAAVAFLEKAASQDGIDLASMSDAQVQAVAEHYFSKVAEIPPQFVAEAKKEGEPPAEEKKEKDEDEDEDEEKKAAAEMMEADFLGRQMAHAFVQELDSIQKTAAAQGQQAQQPAQQEIPEVFLKAAEARALEFLQEKVASGELCACGDPACTGGCKTASAEAQPEMTQAQYIDTLAAEMLQQGGYSKFLSA